MTSVGERVAGDLSLLEVLKAKQLDDITMSCAWSTLLRNFYLNTPVVIATVVRAFEEAVVAKACSEVTTCLVDMWAFLPYSLLGIYVDTHCSQEELAQSKAIAKRSLDSLPSISCSQWGDPR